MTLPLRLSCSRWEFADLKRASRLAACCSTAVVTVVTTKHAVVTNGVEATVDFHLRSLVVDSVKEAGLRITQCRELCLKRAFLSG